MSEYKIGSNPDPMRSPQPQFDHKQSCGALDIWMWACCVNFVAVVVF